MTDADKQELYRIVLADLSALPPKTARKAVRQSIAGAHSGQPDGFLVTNDNLSLFRQYRNSVSPNPDDLIADALKFQTQEEKR